MLDLGRHFTEVSFSTKSFMRFDNDDYTWKRFGSAIKTQPHFPYQSLQP
jgi:hypothetical protein